MSSDNFMFLDTVKLAIPLPQGVARPQNPSGLRMWDVHKVGSIFKCCVNSSFRRRQQEGYREYLPIVEYREIPSGAGMRHEITVEFSIPKLIHHNNFVPVAIADVEEIYKRILDILQNVYGFNMLGIDHIRAATLSRIDCSAVVAFNTHIDLQQALDRIRKTELNGHLDIEEPSFSPTSRGIGISCGSWQFCFYNKTAEYRSNINVSRETSFYPAQTDKEGALVDDCSYLGGLILNGRPKYEQKWDFSILPEPIEYLHEHGAEFMQCELRLNTKDKIKRALKRLGLMQRNFTLDELLCEKIPLKVLQYHWRMILDGLPRNDIQVVDMKDVYAKLMKLELPPKAFFEAAGRICMFQEYDMRELKDFYTRNHGRSGWQRLKKDIAKLPKFSDECDPVQPITNAIFGMVKNLINPDDRHWHGSPYAMCITITLCTKKQSCYRCCFTRTYIVCSVSFAARPPPLRRFSVLFRHAPWGDAWR